MKKILSNTRTLAALLMATATLVACTNDDNITDEPQQPAATGKYTMTIEASKGDGATTRALKLDGSTLNATWATTENVYVQKGSDWATGSLQPQTDGTTATLKGTLSDIDIAADDVLTLQFPRSGDRDYTRQVGTLADIAAKYDYATASVTVASVSASGNINPVAATTTFTNQQAIVKFTLKSKATDAAISASELTVSDGANSYTVKPASATSEIYVAIPGFSEQTVSLTATVGTDTYTYSKSGITFTNGQFYDITVKMTKHEPALGDLYYSDGTYSTTLVAGKTPIGVIAYLDQTGTDDDEITESGNGGGHGLVLCLKNAASNLSWSTNYSSQAYTGNAYVTDAAGLTRLTGASGYNATNAMASVENAATVYPAAYQAKNYTGLAAPATGTTGWFLPSAQQWVKMQQALGGMDGSIDDKTIQDLGKWFDNQINGCTAWETALAKAGSGNYDSMTPYLWYFSSSEHSEQYTILLKMDARETGNYYGFCWLQFSKVQLDNKSRVRPALAF